MMLWNRRKFLLVQAAKRCRHGTFKLNFLLSMKKYSWVIRTFCANGDHFVQRHLWLMVIENTQLMLVFDLTKLFLSYSLICTFMDSKEAMAVGATTPWAHFLGAHHHHQAKQLQFSNCNSFYQTYFWLENALNGVCYFPSSKFFCGGACHWTFLLRLWCFPLVGKSSF